MKKLGLLAGVACLVLLAGCDSNPGLNAVSGSAKYHGKPLPHVVLNFIPVDGRPGQALTDEAGNFERVVFDVKHDGLLTGEYSVVVEYVPTGEPDSPIAPPPKPPEELRAVLKKYGNFKKPEIHVTIEKGQRTLDLNLD